MRPDELSMGNDADAGSLAINQSAIQGEPGTGYEPGGDLGEFECENCEFFNAGSCRQPDMMQKSKLPKSQDGGVQVDPEGCCEYVKRVGRKETPAQEASENESLPAEHPLNQLRAKRL